jgi:hypothetical protein
VEGALADERDRHRLGTDAWHATEGGVGGVHSKRYGFVTRATWRVTVLGMPDGAFLTKSYPQTSRCASDGLTSWHPLPAS